MHRTYISGRLSALSMLVGLALGVVSTPAAALFDLRLTGGTSDAKYKVVADGTGTPVVESDTTKFSDKGTQISLFADLAPIPMVPVAAGLFYSMTNAKGKILDVTDTKVTSGRGGLDMMAWVPMPKIKPYLRAGYYLFGKEEITFSGMSDEDGNTFSSKYDFNVNGYQIGLGVGFSVLPLISVYLDYTIDKYTLTTKKVTATAGGVSTTIDMAENVKFTNDASAISLGVGVSL